MAEYNRRHARPLSPDPVAVRAQGARRARRKEPRIHPEAGKAVGAAAGISRPQPGRRGAGADRAGRHRARRHRGDRRVSRRGLSREDPDRHQPGRPRRGAPAGRLVRPQDEPRGHREPVRREDDAPVRRRRAARTRRRFAPAMPTCRIISIISAIWSSGGAGSPATISRSPTSPRRRISRALDYLGDVPWEAHEPAKEWYARIKSRPSFRPILADHVPGAPPPKHYADLDF